MPLAQGRIQTKPPTPGLPLLGGLSGKGKPPHTQNLRKPSPLTQQAPDYFRRCACLFGHRFTATVVFLAVANQDSLLPCRFGRIEMGTFPRKFAAKMGVLGGGRSLETLGEIGLAVCL